MAPLQFVQLLFVRMPGSFAPSLRPLHGRYTMYLISIQLLCASVQVFLLAALLRVSQALHLGEQCAMQWRLHSGPISSDCRDDPHTA